MAFHHIADERLSSVDGTLYLTKEQKDIFVKHTEHLARIARESKVSSQGAVDPALPATMRG